MQGIWFSSPQSVKMNLRIIKAGVLDTVQDLGRYGWQHLGINPTGAMDKVSARLANILVGNEPSAAVIELHFPASEFFFEQPALIAIAGANFSAHVNGEPIDCNHPVLLSKYSILQFHGIVSGARAYLALHGGLDVPSWLNSCSTHLKAGSGGFHGRPLQKDDEIPMGESRDLCQLIGTREFHVLPWKADMQVMEETPDLLVLQGQEWDRLRDSCKARFTKQSFMITSQSDRMGYRLRSEPLMASNTDELVSTAVNFGTIQLLPDGQLIILMADHQATGGYPRMAHIISAHQPKLAQKTPGDPVSFRFTGQANAEDLLVRQQQQLLQIQNACTFKLEKYLNA